MKTLSFKQSLACFGLILFAGSSMTYAKEGGANGGGGDACERQIKVIRDDIKTWINGGGPKYLNLPAGVSSAQYSTRMLQQISAATIKCVGPGDAGYPVLVGTTPKTCRWDKTTATSKVTCDIQKFNSTEASEQYNLIHHEYAGLSGFELPNADDSHYEISNQISGFLTQELVTKLAVKKPIKDGDAYITYEKDDNNNLNKLVTLKQKDLVAWEVVRSGSGNTYLNFSGAPYGDPGTRMCFVRAKPSGDFPSPQAYLGIAYKDDDLKKAIIAIAVDDNYAVPANIVCMSRDEFFAKYPSNMDDFFNLINPHGVSPSVAQAKALRQNQDLKNYLGCYKALKHNGADVVAADFQCLISVESDSVSYGTVDGENIATILVRAAVKEQYGALYQSQEIIAPTSGTAIKSNGTAVEVDVNAKVLETLNGKPQTGVPVQVTQKLVLADQGGGIVTATFDTQYGEETFSLKREVCR